MCSDNILINNGFLCWASNVTGGKKSSLHQDSNPGPHAYCASSLTTELLRPDLFSTTPGYLVTNNSVLDQNFSGHWNEI